MTRTPTDDVRALVARLPEGWSQVVYDGARWGASRTVTVGGRSQKVYAEELGGSRHVSANLYLVGDGEDARTELRPCEMPAEVVLDFLRGLALVEEARQGRARLVEEARQGRLETPQSVRRSRKDVSGPDSSTGRSPQS